MPAARRSVSHASCAGSSTERCRGSRGTAAPASGLGSATRAFPTCTIRRSATRCPPPATGPLPKARRLRVHHALRARPRTDRRTSPAARRAAREPDGPLPLQQLPTEHHLRRGQIRHPLPGPSRTRRARQPIKACLNGGTARRQHWRRPCRQVLRRPGQPELVARGNGWMPSAWSARCSSRGSPRSRLLTWTVPPGWPGPMHQPGPVTVQPLRSPLRARRKQPARQQDHRTITADARGGRSWPRAADLDAGRRVLGGGLRAATTVRPRLRGTRRARAAPRGSCGSSDGGSSGPWRSWHGRGGARGVPPRAQPPARSN